MLRSGHQVIAAIQFPEVLFKEPHGHPQSGQIVDEAEQERNASAISETADQMLLKANEFVAKYTEHVQRLRRKTLTLIEVLEQVKEERRLLEKERLFRVDELRKCRVEELRTAADKYHAARDKALGASSTGSSSKPICIT